MSRETIVEKKCTCDLCGAEMYTNQKTGEPWSGANITIHLKRFFGLRCTEECDIDICEKCYCKITGKTKEEVGW